jgi:ABC-type transporter Mla subunit MlaD
MSRHAKWVVSLAASLLLTMVLGCDANWGGLPFALTFEDARGLTVGDPVVCRGVEIGQVRSVELERNAGVRVGILIRREHRDAVYQEARFVIERSRDHAQRPGGRQLTVKDRRGRHTPIDRGSTLEGDEPGLGDVWQSLRAKGADALESARDLADALAGRLEEAAESPEARHLREDIDAFLDDAADLAREEWEAFREERLPELRRKAERLRDKMRREGHEEKAKAFWEDFTRWADDLRSRADEEP